MSNTSVADKFNYLVLIFAVSLIISVFAKFTDSAGIQSALFFLLGASFFFNLNNFSVKFSNFFIPMLLFVATAVFSFYNADFQYNARSGIILLSYCGCAYLLSIFLRPYDKRSVLLIPVLIGLWLTIFLFASNVTFSGMASPDVLSKHMRATAGFLILAFCLSLVFWWTERKIYVYTSFILLVAVFLTKSYFAAGLACLAFAAFLFFMREKVKMRIPLVVIPLIAGGSAAFFKAFKIGYFAPKIAVWQTALAVIKDNFVSGVGFCNYSTVSEFYAKTPGFDISQPDNMFLQLLAETGIAGLILFLAVLAVFFILIFKKLRAGDNKTIYLPVMLAVVFFTVYNMFESVSFISTNMLIFFMLLAFPFDTPEIKIRIKKINTYIAILLLLPFLYLLARPIIAAEDYKTGLMFFTSNKYVVAAGCFMNAIERDGLNPAYASKLSDTYFALSQREAKSVNLEKAIEYKKIASSLNRHSGKYYYDLAWLYKNKGEKQLASDYISKAVEMDAFDQQFREAYGELIY